MATPPTLSDFRTRYPAFDAVPDARVNYWLSEGIAEATAWREVDQARGALAYAAHKLAEQGQGGALPGGVTGFKSGTFDAEISEQVANRTGFNATVYGREFLQLAKRNVGGPRLAYVPPIDLG